MMLFGEYASGTRRAFDIIFYAYGSSCTPTRSAVPHPEAPKRNRE
jgi:hypothetical protein